MDEVGFGKIMVVCGVIVCIIEKFWDSIDWIDIFYICFN